MILASVALTLAGGVLLALGSAVASGTWLSWIPYQELGSILIGAGVLGIWLDQYFRREDQASREHQLRAILRDEAPAMRDAVLDAFAANRADLIRIATPETLDRIAENTLALRLEDEQFASEVFSTIHHQAVMATERWFDASVSVDLAPAPSAPDFFTVTTRWEYRTIPRHAQRQFVCLSDRLEYAELAQARDGVSAWFFKPDEAFSARDREAFELVQFTVDGRERPIRRSSRRDYQAYTVNIGEGHGDQPVTISYTLRTVTRAAGHLLFFEVEQPTRDLSFALDYTGCGIDTISALDLVPSIRPTRIEHTPEDVTPKGVRVEIDGWTFPRSGVAFVWTLGSEIARSPVPPPTGQPASSRA